MHAKNYYCCAINPGLLENPMKFLEPKSKFSNQNLLVLKS